MSGRPEVFLVTADADLASTLNELATVMGFRLNFHEPESDKLFVFSCKLRVVNRRVLGKSDWLFYRDLLMELYRPYAEEEQLAKAKCGVEFGEAHFAEPPLILTDGFSPEEESVWGLLPEVGMEVYRIEERLHKEIAAKVLEIVGRGWSRAEDGAKVRTAES